MKIKRQLSNIITIINLFLGFLAILNVYIDQYLLACYFILMAAVLDLLDGKIARFFEISTDFGKELDSLADLVSFCLAPSVLIYILYSHNLPGISGEIIASMPLILGVIRLARYNISSDENKNYFEGLPTTGNAIFICSLIIYLENIGTMTSNNNQSYLVIGIILFSSLLMVSKIRYKKMPLPSKYYKPKNRKLVLIYLFLCFLLIFIFINQKEYFFIILTSSFLFFGIFNHFFIEDKLHRKFINKIIKH